MTSIPHGLSARFQRWFSAGWRRNLARFSAYLPAIAKIEATLPALSADELRKRSLSLRYRAKSNEPLPRLLPEAYALVREAARRTLQMRPFDVQVLGGVALHFGCVVEMQTGEGKTLTATMPLYLAALAGRGAHLATVNDYLARRDADWMRPIYELLGMSVGVVEAPMLQPQRRAAYHCDITYGTAKEFGFDYLRDRLLLRRRQEGQRDLLGAMLGLLPREAGDQPVGRGQHFAIIDEADSIMIDEARTPLIISALPTEAARIAEACYRWAASVASQFHEDRDYDYDHRKKTVELNAQGRQRARDLPKPREMDSVGMASIYEYVERAIRVARDFIRDRHYVVRNGEIVIVDEFTGRLGEGRKWRDGVHQAIEAKENVQVTVETGQAAQITVQELLSGYRHLAGMTGTAMTSARELAKVYKLRAVPIPTNRPCIRQGLPQRVYGTGQAKWGAIVEEVRQLHAVGRPVLIGTRSIDKSEHLSVLLSAAGITHQVLNARHLAAEAKIVAQAGQRGNVTVATNMAGRGTDIVLGQGVAELGGLHVIATELHEAARIDRQLIGRCARQGDPGTYRQYMALDDDILREAFGPKRAAAWAAKGARHAGPLSGYGRLFRKAQRILERKHYRDRKRLMYFTKQRKQMMTQLGQDPHLDVPG
jgi:preprotein translocase subunit SecA